METRLVAQVHYDAERNLLICNGMVNPFKIIGADFIQIGRLLIHRSALEEGGWHEYDLTKLIGGAADG